MSEDEVLAYVQSAAAMLALPLDAERAQAVALHLGRTMAMARLLDTAPLAPHDELVQIYCPAPFPQEDAA